MIIASFMAFLLVFIIIGMASLVKRRNTNTDYLLAGRSVKPWLVGLSATATNASGYMFTGMIGFTYAVGFPSVWFALGWMGGDFIASTFIHKKMRAIGENENMLSYGGVLSHWHGTDYRVLRMVAGAITIIFLGIYAAAQLNAGSKALHVLFGWDYSLGAIIGAGIVLLYCFAGGVRASIWTDAAQSMVMMAAMALLAYVAVQHIGGIAAFVDALYAVSPAYMAWFPPELASRVLPGGAILAPALFLLGWVFSGFGVVGQPHTMTRFLTLDDPKNIDRARMYYFGFYCTFFTLTVITGLAARILIPDLASIGGDAELALPHLAEQLLPEILIGLVLAGLFAATMSTADSQILSCSAAITRDFTSTRTISYGATKLATVAVVLAALGIALFGSQSVFILVLIAWAALASSFAPLLCVYALGGRPSEKTAVSMVFFGLGAMLLWRNADLTPYVFDVVPGILSGFVPYLISRLKAPTTATAFKN